MTTQRRSTYRLQSLEAEHAKIVAKALREGAGRLTLDARKFAASPADLRGLPMIGRGVAGAIRHTQPGSGLT